MEAIDDVIAYNRKNRNHDPCDDRIARQSGGRFPWRVLWRARDRSTSEQPEGWLLEGSECTDEIQRKAARCVRRLGSRGQWTGPSCRIPVSSWSIQAPRASRSCWFSISGTSYLRLTKRRRRVVRAALISAAPKSACWVSERVSGA